jgi:MFS family permease
MPDTVTSRSLGRPFAWLWSAFAVSTFGSSFAFQAFPLIAILVLHANPSEVSALAVTGLAVGAVVAIPLGPWVEFRRKRPVMVAMDLIRFLAVLSVPAVFAFGRLSFVQLLVVSAIVASCDVAFRAASGAYLKSLLTSEDLLIANGRLEATSWTAIALGPPLGGVAMSLLGPVTTVMADALSYLLSASGLYAIGGNEPRPVRTSAPRLRAGDLAEGWRYILNHPALRPLFFNTILVNGLIMATAPLVAVLMLRQLGFWSGRDHAHRRHIARVLVTRPGLHSSGCRGHGARHRPSTWHSHQRGSFQPRVRYLPAQPNPGRPGCTHIIRMDNIEQCHHRRLDVPVGCVGQHHQPSNRGCDRRSPDAGHSVATPATRFGL